MKKNFFLLTAALVALSACENSTEDYSEAMNEKRTVTFAVDGDFEKPTYTPMTRAGLTADGKAMTDLWVLDYQNGALVQQLHQTSEDEDFGTPQMTLDLGQHHVYFVCSRGKTPTLSTDEHTIVWGTTSDTFYKDFAINISSGSSVNQIVTLQRVATKLGITIEDVIPDNTASVTLTPETWYYGIDYLTGAPTAAATEEPREIVIPSSYAGRENVSLSIFGLSGTTEWTTNVDVTAYDADDNIIGQAVINDAPFLANRTTSYTGRLFSNHNAFSLSLNDAWGEEYTGEW